MAENAAVGQPGDLAEKIIDVVVVMDCPSEGDCKGERDSSALEIQNHVLDTTDGGLCNGDMEKRRSEGAEDGAVGMAGNTDGGQPQELVDKMIDVVIVDCPNKGESGDQRDNAREECRVCQEESDEGLIDLGCHCRGALAKAHLSCITKWFQARGSKKCEICQQIAANVALDSQGRYWIWTVDQASVNEEQRERDSGMIIFAALSILIGALLLDVLVSITSGIAALPTNLIIGFVIVLGLGTALGTAMEFSRRRNVRRGARRAHVIEAPTAHLGLGYHPAL